MRGAIAIDQMPAATIAAAAWRVLIVIVSLSKP
jgi:hypothetical protein